MTRIRRAVAAAAVVAALVGMASSADAARARKLKTTKGSMQLGGALSMAVDTFAPDGGKNLTGVVLSVSPSFGYFFTDGLELQLPMIVDLRLGKLYDNTPHAIGFTPGLRYVFATGTIVLPFVGINLGPIFLLPRNNDDTIVALRWRTPAGILIALNPHVGLTVGMALDVNFGFGGKSAIGSKLGGQDVVFVEFLLGYLGVEAFF
jgi:hypothetical protein